MKSSNKKKLEATGCKVASVDEFLGLSDSEMMLVNMKAALSKKVKIIRQRKPLSQERLAKLVGSSQSRIAKMESADYSVSIELFIKTLASMGESRAKIGKVVGSGVKKNGS